jgi:uncharacterized membrane protein
MKDSFFLLILGIIVFGMGMLISSFVISLILCMVGGFMIGYGYGMARRGK